MPSHKKLRFMIGLSNKFPWVQVIRVILFARGSCGQICISSKPHSSGSCIKSKDTHHVCHSVFIRDPGAEWGFFPIRPGPNNKVCVIHQQATDTKQHTWWLRQGIGWFAAKGLWTGRWACSFGQAAERLASQAAAPLGTRCKSKLVLPAGVFHERCCTLCHPQPPGFSLSGFLSILSVPHFILSV